MLLHPRENWPLTSESGLRRGVGGCDIAPLPADVTGRRYRRPPRQFRL